MGIITINNTDYDLYEKTLSGTLPQPLSSNTQYFVLESNVNNIHLVSAWGNYFIPGGNQIYPINIGNSFATFVYIYKEIRLRVVDPNNPNSSYVGCKFQVTYIYYKL